jgi:Tfp pilus assembly protein PilP
MKKVMIFLCVLGLGTFSFGMAEAKRDPFEPFVELNPPRGKKELSPLERYELSQLKLIGIIGSDAQGYRALVEDDAGAGFILTEGTLVGSKGSAIKEIRRDKVIIMEKYRDYMGREKAREVVWTVHKSVP